MSTNLERASLVSRAVQIESVTLTGVAMNTDLEEEPGSELLRLSQRYRGRHEPVPPDSDTVSVRVDFKFEAHTTKDGEPDRRVAEIEAEFRVVYRTESSSEFPADSLQHFAELNGTYNAWPYWRELVQSLTARAGMSGVIVPVFRPRVRKIEVQESLPVPPRSDEALTAGEAGAASA